MSTVSLILNAFEKLNLKIINEISEIPVENIDAKILITIRANIELILNYQEKTVQLQEQSNCKNDKNIDSFNENPLLLVGIYENFYREFERFLNPNFEIKDDKSS